jgi:hypothetical protein
MTTTDDIVERLRKSPDNGEVERLRDLVKRAYHEGFGEGMREVTTSRGGKSWKDSSVAKALTSGQDQMPLPIRCPYCNADPSHGEAHKPECQALSSGQGS